MSAPDDRTELPRWLGDPALIDFTVSELLDHDAQQLEEDAGYDYHALSALIKSPKPTREQHLASAKAAARLGNLKALRALYPEIAEFIAEPKRKRGVRKPPDWAEEYGKDHTEVIDRTVQQIRQVWKQHYKGKWTRPKSDNPTNKIIAAYLSIVGYELSEAEVKRIRKAMAR